jgi:transposase
MEHSALFGYTWVMRPHGTPQQLERRRRQAVRLLTAGTHLSAVARAVGASKSSVCRWYETYRKQGRAGLRPKVPPGRPPKFRAKQKRRLAKLLVAGPLAAGHRTDLWTLKRIAQLIWKQFRIRYHPNHVWRVLHGMGWSCQIPERRALQRDDAAIASWKRSRWPHIKKHSTTWRPSGLPR